jgi:phosphoribosylformimino-5-aminoimidazole carboxamide ribotide isomerase
MLRLAEAQGIKLIASGGISFDELPKLAELGCEGTIMVKRFTKEEFR